MKKVIFVVAAAVLSASAWATQGGEGSNTGCNGVGNANSPCAGNGGAGGAGGQGGAGGTGIGVGVGVGVGVGIAGASSASTAVSSNANTNTNILGQQQGQMQGQQQGQSQTSRNDNSNDSSATGGNATGGAGGNATAAGGNGSGNATTVVVKGAERSAPSLGGAQAPVQVRNCRIGIGFGGSNANGAFTAALPLGNDATCLAGAALEAMEIAGGFSQRSKQTVACTIEGMAELDECKALKESKKPAIASIEREAP